MKKTELFEKMDEAKGKKEVVELVKQYFSELGVNKEGDGRKAQVLECLEVGMTTKEIAEKIGIHHRELINNQQISVYRILFIACEQI